MSLNPSRKHICPYIDYFEAPGEVSLKLQGDVITAWEYAGSGRVASDKNSATFFTIVEVT